MQDLVLYNSLTKKKEKFEPINPPHVGFYTCGMTVYDYAHIGHGRKYVGDDLLRRTLTFFGYQVQHVQNVTDVGHLTSDADEGEDKLEKGAKKAGKTVWEVAKFFEKNFYESMDKLNVLRPEVISRATEHIEDQVKLVEKLIENGFAYETDEAVYFEVSKFKDYGQLFGQDLKEKKVAVRKEVKTGEHKKNPQDFALWFKRTGRFKDHAMHWDSPWGDGFPGWHIECSAMSMKYLGEQFDIHTGGIDHLSIHHPNEIAQSEGATGKKPFVKYWIHHGFLKVDNQKMSKSLDNFYTINDVEKKDFDPLVLRYLYLTAHYRDTLNFTWKSLEAAQNSLNNLRDLVLAAKKQTGRTTLSAEKQEKVEEFQTSFTQALSDDLNAPQALAVLWQVLKSNILSKDKYDLALSFDEVLGLDLKDLSGTELKVPDEVQSLIKEREESRKKGEFEKADEIRRQIEGKGYKVEDDKTGPDVRKI